MRLICDMVLVLKNLSIFLLEFVCLFWINTKTCFIRIPLFTFLQIMLKIPPEYIPFVEVSSYNVDNLGGWFNWFVRAKERSSISLVGLHKSIKQ